MLKHTFEIGVVAEGPNKGKRATVEVYERRGKIVFAGHRGKDHHGQIEGTLLQEFPGDALVMSLCNLWVNLHHQPVSAAGSTKDGCFLRALIALDQKK